MHATHVIGPAAGRSCRTREALARRFDTDVRQLFPPVGAKADLALAPPLLRESNSDALPCESTAVQSSLAFAMAASRSVWQYLVRFVAKEDGKTVFGNLDALPTKPVYEGLKVSRTLRAAKVGD